MVNLLVILRSVRMNASSEQEKGYRCEDWMRLVCFSFDVVRREAIMLGRHATLIGLLLAGQIEGLGYR